MKLFNNWENYDLLKGLEVEKHEQKWMQCKEAKWMKNKAQASTKIEKKKKIEALLCWASDFALGCFFKLHHFVNFKWNSI